MQYCNNRHFKTKIDNFNCNSAMKLDSAVYCLSKTSLSSECILNNSIKTVCDQYDVAVYVSGEPVNTIAI